MYKTSLIISFSFLVSSCFLSKIELEKKYVLNREIKVKVFKLFLQKLTFLLICFFSMGASFFKNIENNSSTIAVSDSLNNITKYTVLIVPHIEWKYRADIQVVSNETGYIVYTIESAYEYFDDAVQSMVKKIDLDKDGIDEFICYGITGGNGGFNEIYIFDFKISIKPVCTVWSMYEDKIFNENIFIDNGNYVNILAKQSAGYSYTKRLFYYPLKYSNGNLSIDYNNTNDVILERINENMQNIISFVKKEKFDCSKIFHRFPFEALSIQCKFINNTEYSDQIIKKYYPCSDENTMREEAEVRFKEIINNRFEFKN